MTIDMVHEVTGLKVCRVTTVLDSLEATTKDNKFENRNKINKIKINDRKFVTLSLFICMIQITRDKQFMAI